MKKIMVIMTLAAGMCACSHKRIATGGRQAPAAPLDNNPGPGVIQAGRYVYQSKCGSCHGLKNVADYTAPQWNGILQTMIPRAKLDELETQQLLAFIKAQARD